jgi:NAD-dependent deacetylase
MANESEKKSGESDVNGAASDVVARISRQLEASKQAKSAYDDLDAKWKAFQARFDEINKLMINSISKQMQPAAADDPRCAELVPPETVAQVLRRSKKVAFLTGAGVSAESGIPTFRGSDGFWTIGSENYRPQEMATFEMFNKHPEELWKWYHMRWSICRNAAPNAGHAAVVDLEKLITTQEGSSFDLITQNIDGLHLAAGSKLSNTYQVHGSMNFMRCDESVEGSCCHGLNPHSSDPEVQKKLRAAVIPWGKEWTKEQVEADPVPRCPKCASRCRPHVLWFDESYTETWYGRDSALGATDAADCLVVVGTTLTTGLPSSVVRKARERQIPIINLDPSAADEPREGMLNCAAKSGEALPKVAACLADLFKEPDLAPLREPPAPTGPLKAALAQLAKQAPAETLPGAKAAVAAPGKHAVAKPGPKAKAKAAPKAAPKAAAKAAALPVAVPPATPSVGGDVRQFFVYGSLRPDDDSGASWTKKFTWKLDARPALLRGASLYQESYAAVVFEETATAVRGMVLTVPAEKWQEKLAEADSIEGYPDLYDRVVADVEVLDKSGRPVGTERAWVYHRTGKFERDVAQRIPDGDWLSRRRGDSPAPAASSTGTVADAVAKDVVQDATPPRFGMELSIYDLPEYPRSTTTS